MNTRWKRTVFCLICLQITFPALANSPVWQVSKGNHHLFLAGTMHVLTKSDFPLPAPFEQAYLQADIIAFETDMSQLQTTEFQQKSMQLLTYENGTKLTDKLSANTRKNLIDYLQERQLNIEQLNHFKPSLMGVLLSLTELKKLGYSGEGVDQYFYTRSVRDKKQHVYFESPEQQLNYLASLGAGEEDKYIQYTLQDLKQFAPQLQQMRQNWRSGNYVQMAKDSLTPMQQDFPNIYQQLIFQRNLAWLPHLEQMLTTVPTELILVGALHLAGQDGLIKTLENKGYKVSEYKPKKQIN
ncbi:TraB/GumN family protein [Neptunicella marina]|uniref:TraB/GumN family protein n=1 Tax=Neptunicella marina TaxID=2125989 RepID=A0A8J6LYG9_9ALTE|nr:TraB/GumN family protein [Neptunicella marina]MBC3765350.1 TraB/GumN family protein [Neptunicella marina]